MWLEFYELLKNLTLRSQMRLKSTQIYNFWLLLEVWDSLVCLSFAIESWEATLDLQYNNIFS